MILLYISVNSSSCRKARLWFNDHHISFTEHNVTSEGISRKPLLRIMGKTVNGTSDILCTRSNAYKSLKIRVNNLSFNDFVSLICRIPELLKTPIILTNDSIQIGFNQDEIRSFIPHNIRAEEIMDLERKSVV